MLVITKEHFKELQTKDVTIVCGCFESGVVASLLEEQKRFGFIEVGDLKVAKSTDPEEEVCFAIITQTEKENLLFKDEPEKTTLILKRITALGTYEVTDKAKAIVPPLTA